MINQLVEIISECSSEGWDGYGAAPVTSETIYYARNLINCLPNDIPSPEIGVEPNGHVTLEWYRNPRRIISVSISPEGDLHYAALMGARQRYGTEPFYGEIPGVICDIVLQVIKV